MQYDRRVLGYHGCSAATAARVLGGKPFKQSENAFDWLGKGIYFWEYGLDRAWQWAKDNHNRPAVVGALIQLGNCFDLLDTKITALLRDTAHTYVDGLVEARQSIPANVGADRKGRRLDCAIINFALDRFAEGGVTYQCVRCGFSEGAPIFDGHGRKTELLMESHVQIAVRDPACILGTFKPRRA